MIHPSLRLTQQWEFDNIAFYPRCGQSLARRGRSLVARVVRFPRRARGSIPSFARLTRPTRTRRASFDRTRTGAEANFRSK